MKLLMIADDFTGAMDTGVQLSRHRIKTRIMVDFKKEQSHNITDCEVLIVNTDTRHDTPITAYNKTIDLLKCFDGQWEYFYIKTDSALRGNISAVFAAARDFLHMPVMFIPAFPDAGRTTVGGLQYVNGEPLEKSVFRDDPLNPMTHSDVSTILSSDCAIKVKTVPVDKVASFDKGDAEVCVFDCENNEALAQIGKMLHEKNCNKITAGCAGFAATFADNITFSNDAIGNNSDNHPLIILSGSANRVTFDQLNRARSDGFSIFVLSPEIKLHPDVGALEKLFNEVKNTIKSGKSAIIATALSKDDLTAFDKVAKDESDVDVHDNIAEIFAQLGEKLIDETSNIAVFGGDTVLALLRQIKCEAVTVADEITVGVPVCLFNYHGKNIRLVTKSGGLATVDAVSCIERYLRG
jgi:D-threonate/D-erythronate kinase